MKKNITQIIFLVSLIINTAFAQSHKKLATKPIVANQTVNPDAIKKWIIAKLAANPGGTSRHYKHFDGEIDFANDQKTSVDETETNDKILVLKRYENSVNTYNDDNNRTTKLTVNSTYIIKWADITDLYLGAAVDTVIEKEREHFVQSAIVVIVGHTQYTEQLTNSDGTIENYTTGANPEKDKNYNSRINFFFDSTNEPDLGKRLAKAFNDLIAYYKANKPKELY